MLDVLDFELFCNSDQVLLSYKFFIVQRDLKINQGQKKNFLSSFHSLKLFLLTEFLVFLSNTSY